MSCEGLAIPAGMLVAPGAIGYAPELDQRLPYDPEAAKAVARRGRLPGRLQRRPSIARTTQTSSTTRRSAARSPRNFSEVGIAVTANPQPKERVWAKIDNRETDFWFGQLVGDRLGR